MSQIGVPQKNILEQLGDGYPATTPAAAGRSAMTLGQTLVDGSNQREGGRAVSDKTPIPAPYRVGVGQPDLPVANTKHMEDSGPGGQLVSANGTSGGSFDRPKAAATRAIKSSKIENATVPAAPLTTGYGAGYGAFSGGSPSAAASDGHGGVGATQVSNANINRVGSRNHASINVIARGTGSILY